jgi:hypothetical protein
MDKKQKTVGFNKSKVKAKVRWTSIVSTLVLTVALLGVVGVLAGKNGNAVTGSAGPLVKIELSGVVDRDGEKVSLEQAKVVKPKEILHWSIVSKNEGDAEAKEYRAVGNIPVGTSYVPGSENAEDSALVKFSIDGGSSFSEKPMIEEKQADGSVKKVPAPADMFTQVRFEWAKPLGSNEERVASYKVRVK